MSEEKPSATIIKGPWKKRSSGPTKEELIIVDQLAMTDEIVNECSMAYLELLAKNGVDIGDRDFMRHITVLTEVIKIWYTCYIRFKTRNATNGRYYITYGK